MDSRFEDSLEELIAKIDFPVTPTAKEVEKHSRFLEWISGIDSEDFVNAFRNYVLPALNIGMNLVDNDLVESNTIKDFYRYRFILDLFNQWDKQVDDIK